MRAFLYIRNFLNHNLRKLLIDIIIPINTIIYNMDYCIFYLSGKGSRVDHFRKRVSGDRLEGMFGHFFAVDKLLKMVNHESNDRSDYCDPRIYFHVNFQGHYLLSEYLLAISYSIDKIKTGKDLMLVLCELTGMSLRTFHHHAGIDLFDRLCECKAENINVILINDRKTQSQ